MGCGFKLKKRLTSSGLNKAYLKHFYGFTLEEIEKLEPEEEIAYLMAIDVINSRNDLRAVRTNNIAAVKKEAVDKMMSDLRKRAYPEEKEKVHSFDEIEKLFKGN